MQHSVRFVPGVGNPRPKIVFVGEAPGASEVENGGPFLGASGKLLGEAIDEMGWKREDVYFTNVVKVRPLNNRRPTLEEIESWTPYLLDELSLMNPYVVILLGATATRVFDSSMRVTRDRGHVSRVEIRTPSTGKHNTFWIAPVFHPAYVLRGYFDKKAWFDDFDEIKFESGLM